MDPALLHRLVAEARVGHLATVTAGGRPHLVPCCFALDGETAYSAVDAKPKSTAALRRLENVRTTGVVALLVDHYEEDWSRLWWVRLDGTGRVLDQGPETDRALRRLVAKYDQYRRDLPAGPVLALDIERWRAWAA